MAASDTDRIREQLVTEARSWVGTPYHLRAQVKGAGVDCGLLPYMVYRKFNLIPEFSPEFLKQDWFSHASTERYLMMVERYLRRLVSTRAYSRIPEAVPGALVLGKLCGSSLFNHSGIVTCWPRAVHACHPRVSEVDVSTHAMWAKLEIAIFDFIL